VVAATLRPFRRGMSVAYCCRSSWVRCSIRPECGTPAGVGKNMCIAGRAEGVASNAPKCGINVVGVMPVSRNRSAPSASSQPSSWNKVSTACTIAVSCLCAVCVHRDNTNQSEQGDKVTTTVVFAPTSFSISCSSIFVSVLSNRVMRDSNTRLRLSSDSMPNPRNFSISASNCVHKPTTHVEQTQTWSHEAG